MAAATRTSGRPSNAKFSYQVFDSRRQPMTRRFLVVLTIAIMGAGIAARAHHSFAATYHEDKTVTIQGKLVQFLFRNPHSFVHVEAPDANGVMQRWAVEWGGAGQLGAQGVT